MKLGFLFPGQGSQAVGMGRALAQRFPEAREVFETADRVLGFQLSRICWEGPAGSPPTSPAPVTTSTPAGPLDSSRNGAGPYGQRAMIELRAEHGMSD